MANLFVDYLHVAQHRLNWNLTTLFNAILSTFRHFLSIRFRRLAIFCLGYFHFGYFNPQSI
ncbi:hypothetical protein DERF_009771 [Dermatophagoides farinae]|uniref:Uncharacterized protein n=1 Tax=Dermatophagoides farinae TaxID=6954 RepID=A0A922HYN2_DERFA|nr:hypothetical protein DERF_009771 [Dermatophagoides farinae]